MNLNKLNLTKGEIWKLCLKILNSFGKEGWSFGGFIWIMVKSQDFTHKLQLKGEDFASSGGGGHSLSWLDFHFLQLILASKQTFHFNRNQREPRQNSKQVSSKQF